jgi:cystathionine beta-lyase/cystathionine gamma-synthase
MPVSVAKNLSDGESLIERPMVMSYYYRTTEERQRFSIQDNMTRMSCDIENANDLINDLEQALRAT